jgi:hypothetical protein
LYFIEAAPLFLQGFIRAEPIFFTWLAGDLLHTRFGAITSSGIGLRRSVEVFLVERVRSHLFDAPLFTRTTAGQQLPTLVSAAPLRKVLFCKSVCVAQPSA